MGPLSSILPSLPWTTLEIIMNVVAGLGAIMIVYGVFLEAERRQDAVFAVGSACLFIYALWVGNTIFSIAMGGFALASFIELMEIMLGRHQHSEELVEKYRHPEKN
ncbi:MAG: hypothetical protein NTW66_02025 [Candidatus Magasanikbacteria bacterium]|nr:hypothetical protein [Candidatus Magasanikbacteria bacterium]